MNVGIVGCGYWGPNLVRNVVESKRTEKVYVFDKDVLSVRRLQARFPSLVAAESYEELLNNCEAVMIATPVLTHYALAKQALERKVGVFVEKPLCRSSLEAAQLINLADRQNVALMVGHTFVYSPAVRKVKSYIQDGTMGDLYFVSSSRVNLGKHRSDVDVIWDLAPHDLSMVMYWLNESPKSVAASGRACVGRMLDIASVQIDFASGVYVNLEVSWLAPRKLRRTVIVGKKSMVIYDDTANDKIQLHDRGVLLFPPTSFGEHQLSYRTGDIISPNLDVSEPLLLQTNHFLDCVEQKRRPITDGVFGMEIVRILEACAHSLRRDGSSVAVESVMSHEHHRDLRMLEA